MTDVHRAAPQGLTNLDLLHEAFQPAEPLLSGVADQTDALRVHKGIVELETARLAAACAHARITPTGVARLIDSCRALTAALGLGLPRIEPATEQAHELVNQALAGLAPAQQNLNVTHAQGASGEIYAAFER